MVKSIHRKPTLWALLGACVLITLPVAAAEQAALEQAVCGADEREAFLNAANDGVPAEELVALFAHCLDSATDGLTDPGEKALGLPEDKIITINNALANTFYEQMNGCGYHPQIGFAVCDVEIKQTFGFGPFGPAPLGSTEFVDFCFVCGGAVIPVQGTVHVTDNISLALPSYGMMAFAAAPPACGVPAGTGAAFTIVATLSWGVPAIAPCTAAPIMVWGNRITFDTRDDP